MKKLSVLLLILMIALIAIPVASVQYFYISDGTHKLTFGTGTLTFPNISGTHNDIEIRIFDNTTTHDSLTWTSQKIQDEIQANSGVDYPLPSPVQIGSTPVYLRDNSGVLEYSNTGSDWKPVGSGGSSEYALRGPGTGNVASATFSPSGHFNNDTFSLYGMVLVDQLARAESFYKRVETEYSETILNFGKDSSNRLQITIGTNTYTSGTVFTADHTGVPLEVGVICDKLGGTVAFFYEGRVEASQSATFTYPSINLNEQHLLGDGLDGDMFFFSITQDLIFDVNTKHTPLREGLSQCPSCVIHYNMSEGEGTTLTDRYAEQKGSTAYDLTVNGSWQEYPERY